MECQPYGTTTSRRGGTSIKNDRVRVNAGRQSCVLAFTNGSTSNQDLRRSLIGLFAVLPQKSSATRHYRAVLYDQTTAIRVYRRLQLTFSESTAKIGPSPYGG